MSFGYFEFVSDMDENQELEPQDQNPETPGQTSEESTQKDYVDVEDNYPRNYADGYVTDRLDIFNAHNPILAGVDLKVTKPDPIDFGKVVVGHQYQSSFNIMMQGCKNPVTVSTSAEGITFSPATISAELLNEGTEVQVNYVPTVAQGLYGGLNEYIGFNGELQGVKLEVKANVYSSKLVPVLKWSAPTWEITLSSEENPVYEFPVLTFEENFVPTYTSSDPEVAYMDTTGDNPVIKVLKAGTTTFTAHIEETDEYDSVDDSFELTVVDPNAQPVDPTPDPDPQVNYTVNSTVPESLTNEVIESLNPQKGQVFNVKLAQVTNSSISNVIAIVVDVDSTTSYILPLANESNYLIIAEVQNGAIVDTGISSSKATNANVNSLASEFVSAGLTANSTINKWAVTAESDQVLSLANAVITTAAIPSQEPEEPEQETQTYSVVNAELTGNDGEEVTLLNNN